MTQRSVSYTGKEAYPGMVVRGTAVTRSNVSRDTKKFRNSGKFHIPYGYPLRYTVRDRTLGEVAGYTPETAHDPDRPFFFGQDGIAGIAAMPDPYSYQAIAQGYKQGYDPGDEIYVLQDGDMWVEVWQSVKAYNPITFKLKPFWFTFIGENKLTGLFSSMEGSENFLLKNCYWLTNANKGELALARLKFTDPISSLIDLGGDPF